MSEEDRKTTIENFDKVIDQFFNQDIGNFVILKGSAQGVNYGLPKDASSEELLKRVENVSAEYVMEIGDQEFRYHTHGLFSIKKRGVDTKLNYSKIREYLNEKCGYTVHFDAKLYTDAKKNLQEYLQKSLSKN